MNFGSAFVTNSLSLHVQKLFSPSRWDALIGQFRRENFTLYQLSSQSTLSITLQAGLSALKTPYPPLRPPPIPSQWYDTSLDWNWIHYSAQSVFQTHILIAHALE